MRCSAWDTCVYGGYPEGVLFVYMFCELFIQSRWYVLKGKELDTTRRWAGTQRLLVPKTLKKKKKKKKSKYAKLITGLV